MFQLTPPSPAASMDSLMVKPEIICTAGDGSGNALGPYWQTQSHHGRLEYGVAYADAAQYPPYMKYDPNVMFPLYPSSIGSTCDSYGTPSDTSGFALLTPETSPKAQPETPRPRYDSVAPLRSQAGALRASGRPRKQTAKDRRTNRKKRELKRRDTSKFFGKSLSELAEENPDVVVPDAEAFANRPIETRHQEAASAGKIKRPLNAFMLYRRSYQNMAKSKCLRNNHQQVSTVCGDSWKFRESNDVIDKFNRLAVLEKEMHELAFPEYKYDPVPNKRTGDGNGLSASAGRQRKRAAKVEVLPKLEPAEFPKGGAEADVTTANLDPTFDVLNLPYFNQPPSYTPFTTSPFSPATPIDEQTVYTALDAQSLAKSMDEVLCDVIDPSLFFLDESYIDTALLMNDFDPECIAVPSSMPNGLKLEDESYSGPFIKPEHDLFLSNIDFGVPIDPFLRAPEEDWEIQWVN